MDISAATLAILIEVNDKMEANDQRKYERNVVLFEDFFNKISTFLSDDDIEKLKILSINNEVDVVQWDSTKEHMLKFFEACNVESRAEYWTEALFLLQRYDLLEKIGARKGEVYERVKNKTCFTTKKRCLVKIYSEIPRSKEKEFCAKVLQYLNGHSHQLSDCSSLSTVLLEFDRILGIDLLEDIFLKLGLQSPMKECVRYKEEEIDVYPMNTDPCGICIIINIMNVVGKDRRDGSDIDKKCLEETFQMFNFIIRSYDDRNHIELTQILDDVSHEDHSKYSAFVCCVMTHGKKGAIYCADGLKKDIDDIVSKFCGDNCKTLIGKPKIFLFQVCQGNNLQKANIPNNLRTDGLTVVPNKADCLIGKATVDGSASIRDVKKGSWFIQAIVETLKKTNDFYKVHSLVNKKVSDQNLPYNSMFVSQTSTWESTLTKALVLKKKKLTCNKQ